MKQPHVEASGVVCCGDCGEPVELRCANGHEPEPFGLKPIATKRTRRAPGEPKPVHIPKTNRTYQPKACVCGAIYTPTGPRSLRCPTCRGLETPAAPVGTALP